MSFGVDHHRELVVVDPVRPDHVVVDHDRTVLADRTHRQLTVPRHTELADQDHVDGRRDRACDLVRHGDTAAGQTHDDHGFTVGIPGERCAHEGAEPPACVDAVVEHDLIVPRRTALR